VTALLIIAVIVALVVPTLMIVRALLWLADCLEAERNGEI